MIINAIDVEQLKNAQERLKADPSSGNKEPTILSHWMGGGSAEITAGERKIVIA